MACPGPVPHWEVSLLVDPPQQPEGSPVLSLKEHQALISLAEAARDRGDAHRAYSLAEKAYTGRRAISSLLYALDIRMHELKEPAFCAAAYELILGRTLSAEDRTVCETAQCAAIKLLETERERDEASEGTARLAQRAGELRDAAERFRAAAGYSSKSLSSTMPTVTMAVVDAVDAAADVDAVKDVAAERGTTPWPQAESSPQWLRQAAPALYGVGSSSASTSDAAAPSTSVVATRSPARRIASLDDDDDEEEGNDDESRPPPVHIPRTPRGTPETMMGLIGRSRCAAASPLYTSRVPTLPFEIQRSREMNASTDSGVSLRSHRLVRFNSHRLHEEEEEEESTSLEAIAERQRARARERERAHERERAYERERARQSERARRTPSTPPLISPLLPRRLPRREHAGTLAPRMPQGPCGGVFGTVHLLVSQLQSALHSSSRLFQSRTSSCGSTSCLGWRRSGRRHCSACAPSSAPKCSRDSCGWSARCGRRSRCTSTRTPSTCASGLRSRSKRCFGRGSHGASSPRGKMPAGSRPTFPIRWSFGSTVSPSSASTGGELFTRQSSGCVMRRPKRPCAGPRIG